MNVRSIAWEDAVTAEGVDGENLICISRIGDMEIRHLRTFDEGGEAITITSSQGIQGVLILPD